MKTKLAVVKYFDWVILAILGVLLLFALWTTFLGRRDKLAKSRSDMRQAIRETEGAIKDEDAKELEYHDYLSDIQDRFVRLPVINTLHQSYNPFEQKIAQPVKSIILKIGGEGGFTMAEIRIVKLFSPEGDRVKITSLYDEETHNTRVTILGKEECNVSYRMRDDEDRFYVGQIVVKKEPKNEPLPPVWAGAYVYRAREDKSGVRTPAQVVIVVIPRNTGIDTDRYSPTNGVSIWRKPRGAPDSFYVRQNPKLIELLSRNERAEMLRIYAPPRTRRTTRLGESPGGPQDVPAGADGFDIPNMDVDPDEPRGVPRRDNRRRSGLRRQIRIRDALRPGSFAYVDRTVDEGESYSYKVVTVASIPGQGPIECSKHYALWSAADIPTFITFIARTVSPSGATMFITRHIPGDVRQIVSKRFRIQSGMPIGGTEVVSYLKSAPGNRFDTAIQFKVRTEVDFSTGCVLVGEMTQAKRFEYKIRQRVKDGEFILEFAGRARSGPRALYLTPLGSLRVKLRQEKTEEKTKNGNQTETIRYN